MILLVSLLLPLLLFLLLLLLPLIIIIIIIIIILLYFLLGFINFIQRIYTTISSSSLSSSSSPPPPPVPPCSLLCTYVYIPSTTETWVIENMTWLLGYPQISLLCVSRHMSPSATTIFWSLFSLTPQWQPFRNLTLDTEGDLKTPAFNAEKCIQTHNTIRRYCIIWER